MAWAKLPHTLGPCTRHRSAHVRQFNIMCLQDGCGLIRKHLHNARKASASSTLIKLEQWPSRWRRRAARPCLPSSC